MRLPSRKALGKHEINSIKNVIKYYKKIDQDPPYQSYFENIFCSEFSKKMGNGYADICATGSVALLIALQALEINNKIKRDVLISPVTDPSPYSACIFLGLNPIIVDSKEGNYNIDLENIKKKITQKTAAIIIVHTGGVSSQINKIIKFAKKNKIKTIEDCSQSPFAKCNWCIKKCEPCKNKFVGEFADISIFSTMFAKTISSCGSGGVTFTKNKNYYKKLLSYADRGKDVLNKKQNPSDPRYCQFPALNFNSNEFSSAIMSASLNRVDKTIKDRRQFLKLLNKKIENFKLFKIPNYNINFSSPFYYPIELNIKNPHHLKFRITKFLKSKGVMLNEDYGCVASEWKWLSKTLKKKLTAKNASEYRKKTFNLFLNENYKTKEVNFISKCFGEANLKFKYLIK
jgi:dTDP-4-amino-4,6-dideoxygalactose transaminase